MLLHANALAILALALAIDAVVGDPDAIWRRWPHPVAWFGSWIAVLDRRLNREGDSFLARRGLGIAAVALAVAPFARGGPSSPSPDGGLVLWMAGGGFHRQHPHRAAQSA